MPAIAIANNDVAFAAWKYDAKIPNCLGFAVYRIDDTTGAQTPLPAWVGFQGDSNPDWRAKTTADWPVQKFTWRDLTANRGATCRYKIVPMIGVPGNLQPDNASALTTNPVTLTADRGDISAYFNRGILSTQSLAHQLPAGPGGRPDYVKLDDRIDQPGDPLRNRLSGQLREALLSLLDRAGAQGGQLYCALYELTDPELEQKLIGAKFAHVILSNTGSDDSENAPARQALHEAGTDVMDRMLSSGHIGHNKFAIYVDAQNRPQAVLSGSTNWTATALCGQSNNAVIIESPQLAQLYFDYWNRLLQDGQEQGPTFRASNNQRLAAKLDGGATDVSLWFSPNTKQKSKPSGGAAATPSDMQDVFDAMDKASQSILFLAFQPGSPSIVEEAGKVQDANAGLFIHGAVTDPQAVQQFDTQLFHRSGSEPDATVVAASAIDDQFAFWQKELLKSSPGAHAIIHDKIVVIDPFSPDCAVITGSHNLGFRASYNNDENLLLIRGNRSLAAAYAVHVMDVYDHYRWRYTLQQKGNHAFSGLSRTDAWQDKYFLAGSLAQKELDFWMAAATQPAVASPAAQPAALKPAAPKKAPQTAAHQKSAKPARAAKARAGH